MPRWNLSIREETDRRVRAYLGRTGFKKGDLSRFVDDAVRGEVLRRTVVEVHENNRGLSAEEAMTLADEAMVWARANPT